MNLDYRIKELSKEDLAEDYEGFLETLENLSETGKMNLEETGKILEKINSQNGIIYIAKTSKREIVGTVKLIVEQKFIHHGGKIGHIEDVAVRKGYEGNNIASALINEAISFAKQIGCYKIILDCKDELIPFYSRLGFYKNENCMRVNLN